MGSKHEHARDVLDLAQVNRDAALAHFLWGLVETLDSLHVAGFKTAGAGKNRTGAETPAELPVGDNRRVLVVALGAGSSGVPANWAATDRAPGVAFLADLSDRTLDRIARRVLSIRRPGDLGIASIHWGPSSSGNEDAGPGCS